jgi:uncharacterized membrane protein YphA (DoxX/SURF4 family)
MLSVFPIHFLALFAYFILRIVVSFLLLDMGIKHFMYRRELKDVLKLSWWPYGAFTSWVFAVGEIVLGVLIFVGAWMQLATLIVAIMSLKMLIVRNWYDHHTIPSKSFYFLLLGASLSLTITGAGVFAFDLPL